MLKIKHPVTHSRPVSPGSLRFGNPVTRELPRNQIVCCDALKFAKRLPDKSINCVISSPPYYGLRSYLSDEDPGKALEIGNEQTIQDYVDNLVALFREIRRVLRDDGTVWLNLGDSYANDTKWGGQTVGRNRHKSGLPSKSLMGIPWRVALALQADGWILRNDIIWSKPNPMTYSGTDRFTVSHEYIFFFTKSPHYFFDQEAVKEPAATAGKKYSFTTPSKAGRGKGDKPHGNEGNGKLVSYDTRNKRTVWEIVNTPSPFPHYATFCEDLILPAILAGCPENVCAVCGAPIVRIIEKEKVEVGNWQPYEGKNASQDDQFAHKRIQGNLRALRKAGRDHDNPFPKKFTIGWQPSCQCGAGTKPGVIYDPFMGAGTVAVETRKNKRDFVGSDLNQHYVDIAFDRLRLPFEDRKVIPVFEPPQDKPIETADGEGVQLALIQRNGATQ